MENIKHGIEAMAEKAKEMMSGASYEANKEVAKDSDQPLTTRANAAVNAVKDKVDETSHSANKEAHKQMATH